MKMSKDIKEDLSLKKKKMIIIRILILTPCNKNLLMLFFSLILISKIITVHLLVINVVKIIIYSLTLETKAWRFFFFF